MNKIRCAVIGVGYLGKFHAEKYAKLAQAELVAVCDTNAERAQEIALQHQCEAVSDYHTLLGKVDAVSIATPTINHFQIALDFLTHGSHVLVEKPICETVSQAQQLIELAQANGLILQVGHLERFNSVFLALEHYLENPTYIESIRLAPFKPRATDVNVILDLMIHDIDLIRAIVKSPIKNISASGALVLSKRIDLANAHIQFENGCVANVTASRVNLSQKRKLRIYQQHAHLSVDFQDKKISYHRKGSNEMFPGIPEIITEVHAFEHGDALYDEIQAFLNSIQQHTPPTVDGDDGKIALETAIQITQIIRQQLGLEQLSPTATC